MEQQYEEFTYEKYNEDGILIERTITKRPVQTPIVIPSQWTQVPFVQDPYFRKYEITRTAATQDIQP